MTSLPLSVSGSSISTSSTILTLLGMMLHDTHQSTLFSQLDTIKLHCQVFHTQIDEFWIWIWNAL
ncbi:hypothetical protein WG66_005079 [Moniliophthora roreri]|nr:hypothetical protein WG66_005079 [Moniliophthora roreri]